MSSQGQRPNNLVDCKDCLANGITKKVLWVDNPSKPGGRMPIDFDVFQQTGQQVRHNCPYWKKQTTAAPTVVRASSTVQQPLPPKIESIGNELKLDQNTTSILSNLVLALQSIADELVKANQFLEILANKEVLENKTGVQSALKLKEKEATANNHDMDEFDESQLVEEQRYDIDSFPPL